MGSSPMARVRTHKRVYRLCCELDLNLRLKPRRRLKRENPEELAVPHAPNLVWSLDFRAECLADGRRLRLLTVPDDFNREGLGFELDVSLPAGRVVRSLNPSSRKRSTGPFPGPPPHRMAWKAIGDPGREAGHRPDPHSARQAPAERPCRAHQPDSPEGMAGPLSL